jgi:membrane-bound metal-dependent hydrolase YbcI (DUF457 family)
MFIGHFGVALAGKRFAPVVGLGTCFAAAQFADLLWPNLVLLGIERFEIAPGATAVTPLNFISYPYSHSLLSLAVIGAIIGGGYWFIRRAGMAPGITIAALVVSHWVLDAVTHRPDMPLTLTGSERVGLGLWNSVPATVVVEALLFAGGLALYLRATRARDRIGRWGLAGLVLFLIAIAVANLVSPPPPSVSAVAWSAQAMWLIVIAGFWVDRHRMAHR